MKKLLTILILLLAVCNHSINAEIVYSGDAHNVGENWNAKQLPKADYPVLAKAQAGDVIAITVTAVGDETKRIVLQNTSWQGLPGLEQYIESAGTYYFVLNESNATEIATNGLIVTGENYAFNKVELLYKKSLWTGTLNGTTDWVQSDALDKSLFSSLSEGSLLGIGVSGIITAEWHSACLRYNYESNVLDLSFSEVGIKVKQLTGTDVTQLKAEGKDINLIARYLCISELCTYVETGYSLSLTNDNGSITVEEVCGSNYSETTKTTFASGTSLRLTATPAAGYNFVKWTDGTSDLAAESDGSLLVTMDANKTITAVFALKPTKDLSTGSRKIRSNSSLSISNSNGKFDNLSVGDVLTLAISDIRNGATYTLKGYNEATGDDAGYNWQGFGDGAYTVDVDNGKITCVLTENILNIIKKAGLFIEGTGYTVGTITVRTNGNVTAGTHTDETFTLTINEVIGGSVTVKQGGSATNVRTFPMETEITLEPAANTGFTFSKWMKGDTEQTAGVNNSLALSITDNVSVTALFNAQALADDSYLTIWEGEKEAEWGELLQLTSSVTNILERFETIRITVSPMAVADPNAYFKVFFNTIGDDSKIVDWESAKITAANQVVEYNLPTTTIVDQLKGGFGIFGQNVKITKVDLYKPDIPVALGDEDIREVWSNENGVALNWGNNEISISALDAHILEAGEQVIITSIVNQPESGDPWPKAFLADGSKAVSPTIDGTECRITLTSEIVEKIKDGFYISGGDSKAKKIEFYKPVVIFIDGKANLDRGTESSGSTTLTAPHDEAVTGNVMVVNLTETNPDAKVKVTYSDGSSIEIAPSKRKVGTPTATQVVVPLNMEKYIKSVSVNTAKAKISEIYMTTISAFEADASNFVADLSLAKAQDNVLYNPSTYTIAASTGWTGIALSKNSADADIKGAEVKITFEGDAQVKTTVYYTDDTNTGDAGSMSEAASSQKLKIDATKTIREIQIQPTSASVVQLKEVRVNATETEDEPEGGDDDDEPIIDEKTGETDLSELTAQNDTKTTLTQNEDGSITMTTTEAYCAAQIWFNDPEPVAGNVLKVELAESKVNVTVTVKYTDGSESQMSANTKAVVSARATTRAVASGTTIEVPLETGKEVQNIEVKNNEAGTITIKKMQVTTINVFTGGVANLAMLKPQSNATYDTSAHTLATTKGWTGATVSPVAGENVSGKELLIEFADASKVKVSVKYRTDVEGPSKIMDKAAKSVRLALDNTKNIQEISIQPTEAAIITFTKIAVNSEESDDGSLKPGKTITLWESATGETLSWNEVAKQDASVGEMLKEYDELLITVSGVVKDCDWPKLFIRDASSEQAGNEVLLNDVGSFPYTVRIVLTGEMAQQLQKGFSICGDGVTVKKLQVYRPEAPKTGDIHLADLNYGYNSSYDKGSHTITTTARWAARGWEIGDKRYNDKNLITVKFEAVDFPVTLKMEYTTGLQTAQATSVGVPAGRTELLLEIPKGISKLNRVYIIYENPGKVKLTEASVTYMENLKLSTAIQAFEADGVIRDGRYDTDGWYNLRGMRIPEPTTSGIYIHGGKKVVIY